MKKYDIICPHCGHRNNSLHLQETEGWFECENCLTLGQVSKVFEHRKILPLKHTEDHVPRLRMIGFCV